MKTAADPAGTEVLGTLNNCGNGRTPWGTYLTCEENFNGYFGWNGARTPTALENRYGITAGRLRLPVAHGGPALRRQRHAERAQPPRLDRRDRPLQPRRQGRQAHGARPLQARERRTAWWRRTARSSSTWAATSATSTSTSSSRPAPSTPPTPQRGQPRTCSTDGTLYVARFDAGATAGDQMGTGVWVPLVFGQSGLDRGQRLHQPGRRDDPRAPGRRPRGRHDDGPPGMGGGQPEEGAARSTSR